jgi:hypothetical protein
MAIFSQNTAFYAEKDQIICFQEKRYFSAEKWWRKSPKR